MAYSQKVIDKFEKKNVDVYIFDSVKKIMNNYKFDEIMSLYNSDKNIISLLMYENFLGEIVHNKKDKFNYKFFAFILMKLFTFRL